MAQNDVKPKLRDLLERARQDEKTFWEELSEAERSAVGTLERWSAKDIVAHISFWTRRFAEHLAAVARGEQPAGLEELEQMNERVFKANRDRDSAQIQADAGSAYDTLAEVVGRLTEGKLADPAPFNWYNSRPLGFAIVANSFIHPETHLADYFLKCGNLPRATAIHQDMAKRLVDFDDSDMMRGLAWYNLACFYALAGNPARATELLRQALPLRPDLVEWSKEDSDLTSLRELPDFQALYAS